MSKPEDFNIDLLISSLQGTCQSLDETIKQVYGEEYGEDIMSEEDRSTLDNEIFKCETCDWWCEIGDQDSEGNCLDCSTEEEEDD